MAAIAPVPPEHFKKMLERYGFQVEEETEYNWTLYKEDAPRPVIVIPRKGELVALDILHNILNQLGIDNKTFFDLRDQIQQ